MTPAVPAVGSSAAPLDAELLRSLFDYAGIFPPAQHALPVAMAEYRRLRSGPWSDMVGPFLVKSSLLAELASDGSWTDPIGVIADQPFGDVADAVCATRLHVAQVECADTAFDLAIAAALPDDIVCMVEVTTTASAHGVSVTGAVEQVAEWAQHRPGVVAKVRTGGVAPGSTISDDDLVDFIVACRRAGLRWKATAGLHQPLRHHVPELSCHQHGFLNVLAATWAVEQGAGAGAAMGIIRATTADTVPPMPAAVRSRLMSIGSCSIDEPAEALRQLGMLSG